LIQRQLTFGSVKKVINTVTNAETTYAPEQIPAMNAPSATATAAGKTKLYLPSKKNSGDSPAATGV